MVERYIVLKDCNDKVILTLSTQEAEYDILYFYLIAHMDWIKESDIPYILISKPFDTDIIRLNISKDEFSEEYGKYKEWLKSTE